MSDYPFDNRVNNTDDAIIDKPVFSADGVNLGNSEVVFANSFIVNGKDADSTKNIKIKYEIPRLEIDKVIDGAITLKCSEDDIRRKYETSSIEENWDPGKKP